MPPPDRPPPNAADPRPFDEPWQAQVFAMTLALYNAGHFTWDEWAATLSPVLHAEQARDTPTNGEYYRCWLIALEQMLFAKALADPDVIASTTAAWHRAARNTPHGQPISLDAADK